MTTEQPIKSEVEVKDEFPHKIFVGNLVNDQKEEELNALFEPYGKIVQTLLYLKKRSNYAFISFETLEQAEKAAKEGNGKDLNGNSIKVEIARPKAPRRRPKARKPRAKGPRKPKAKKEGSEEETKEGEDKPKETSNGTAVKEENNSSTKEEKSEDTDKKGKNSSKGPRRGRGGFRGRGRGGRAHKSAKPTGEPNPTTLFVANLPFSLSDEGLRQVFESFDVVSAHVVRRSATGHSKGFGFVELKSNEEQQRVLREIGEVEINTRILNISVAHSEPYVPPSTEEEKSA
ncbi:RNA-binding domain-containing protein [Neoconidiobolus thromboides FSU 785]|nr:RNA-binding domain-containing protein [Neoconidiobolus thromboides FSU 785]